MKLVRAIVRDVKITEIITALNVARVDGVTVTAAVGTGRTPHVGVYRGRAYQALTHVNVVEVMVSDSAADEVVRILLDCAHTGCAGDGHVMVLPIEERYSIRTRWLDVA